MSNYVYIYVGAQANEVFKDGCLNLMTICQHVLVTFSTAVEEFKKNKSMNEVMKTDDTS